MLLQVKKLEPMKNAWLSKIEDEPPDGTDHGQLQPAFTPEGGTVSPDKTEFWMS